MMTQGDPCPQRKGGLTHVTGGGVVCLYCSTLVIARLSRNDNTGAGLVRHDELPVEFDQEREPALVRRGPQGSAAGPGRGDLSPRQIKMLTFLSWMRVNAGLD